MIDLDFDVCAMFKGDQNTNLTSVETNDTNVFTCPLKGNIYAKNMDFRISKVPAVFPSGSWRMDFNFFVKENGKTVHGLLGQLFVDLKYIGDIKH